MTRRARSLDLTADLVARIPPVPAGPPPEGIVYHTDEEIEAMVRAFLAEHPAGEDVPVFAFGSLLWKQGFEADDAGPAVARGWHRAFRMSIPMHRGTPDRPGLMMGLDRGGTCRGILLRIAADRRSSELHALFKREMPVHRPGVEMYHRPHWIAVDTPRGRRRAIAFVMNPRGPGYVRLPLDETVRILSTAAGSGGSCAEYLHLTVEHLTARGIHDRNLWRLQALVARHLRGMDGGQNSAEIATALGRRPDPTGTTPA